MHLHGGFERSAARWPQRVAIEEPDGTSITYADLDSLSNRLRDRLAYMGVRPGERVGIQLHKSIDSVATILGILKCGACYVPVDPTAPASRNAYIFANCSVSALVVENSAAQLLVPELATLGAQPHLLVLDALGGGRALHAALGADVPEVRTVVAPLNSLAYVLYTSGSTGKPKGVMISHCNARRFVDWCSIIFQPTELDRFTSHAPFHFDLSILDIYSPFEHGATLLLIPEDLGKDPQRLTQFIADKRITIWYSTPSILSLLVEYGDVEVLRRHAPHLVLFAGEVFPIARLNALRAIWPSSRYFNLYGPTETNVCTYYELPAAIESDRREPYPIGVLCEHYRGCIVDEDGVAVANGEKGELVIAGDGVMSGYWNLAAQSATAFLERDGVAWYRTGDVVFDREGLLYYAGRRDRMVKKRGYRVELGEIEASLHRHPRVLEAAVVAVTDAEAGVTIHAHISTRDGQRLSLIQLKSFCSEHLPIYMVPDRIHFHESLPKTSTDKTDYQTLLKHS